MKIYIMTDLEGPAGVSRWVQTREGETPEKRAAMRLLTGEVNAAIDGILDVAPHADILAWDGHGSGGGLIFEELHDAARVVLHGVGMGSPHHLDATFDAVYFVGQHAMAGTPNAPLCHTYSSRTIEWYTLNDEPVGEIGCFSAMAGAFGVPVCFLSGDDKACAEARAIIPEIVTVDTKQGLGLELAVHLSHRRSCDIIRAGAAQAIRKSKSIPPYIINGPSEPKIRLQDGADLKPLINHGMEQLDDQTVILKRDSLLKLFM